MMIPKFLLLALLATGAASARGLAKPSAGFRLGVRTGPAEFTPEIGVAGFMGPAYVTVDGWYQPFQFRINQENETYYAGDEIPLQGTFQFRERRWGFTQGIHYDLGNRMVGIVPGAGWEVSWGDWEGDTEDPPFESVGWVGGALRILPYNHLGFKYYPSDTRSGSWKIEYVLQVGGPKRR